MKRKYQNEWNTNTVTKWNLFGLPKSLYNHAVSPVCRRCCIIHWLVVSEVSAMKTSRHLTYSLVKALKFQFTEINTVEIRVNTSRNTSREKRSWPVLSVDSPSGHRFFLETLYVARTCTYDLYLSNGSHFSSNYLYCLIRYCVLCFTLKCALLL